MIRVDENTYIDDTLVTCAEYQLFIDEMREQGKYFQPDHWASYQFLEGQARAPIVGMRFSDAKIFCEWMTKRESSEWSFRLPTVAEAEQYSLKNPIQSPLGYWITGENYRLQFRWIEPVPTNPRGINPVTHIKFDLARLKDIEHAREFTLLIDRDDEFIVDLYDVLERELNMDRMVNRIENLRLNDYRFSSRWFTQISDRLSYRLFDDWSNIVLPDILDFVIGNSGTISFTPRPLDVFPYLDLYIDFLTLYERIAGRSPAFEGIRLVKERVKQ
jgi:hypothetical protein